MEIKRCGSRQSGKGPEEYFTGIVRIDPLFESSDPARPRGASVTFEPCARTAWHTQPLGQTLIVTSGIGRVQRWGGPIEDIRPGDVVSIAPEEKHWHGASPTVAMTHINSRGPQWESRRLDGKGQRRRLPTPKHIIVKCPVDVGRPVIRQNSYALNRFISFIRWRRKLFDRFSLRKGSSSLWAARDEK
jgi:quercetin dioxygenase-like cupin family protein